MSGAVSRGRSGQRRDEVLRSQLVAASPVPASSSLRRPHAIPLDNESPRPARRVLSAAAIPVPDRDDYFHRQDVLVQADRSKSDRPLAGLPAIDPTVNPRRTLFIGSPSGTLVVADRPPPGEVEIVMTTDPEEIRRGEHIFRDQGKAELRPDIDALEQERERLIYLADKSGQEFVQSQLNFRSERTMASDVKTQLNTVEQQYDRLEREAQERERLILASEAPATNLSHSRVLDEAQRVKDHAAVMTRQEIQHAVLTKEKEAEILHGRAFHETSIAHRSAIGQMEAQAHSQMAIAVGNAHSMGSQLEADQRRSANLEVVIRDMQANAFTGSAGSKGPPHNPVIQSELVSAKIALQQQETIAKQNESAYYAEQVAASEAASAQQAEKEKNLRLQKQLDAMRKEQAAVSSEIKNT